ncbi:DUF971 domain-containing protein [Marinimicrobium sp. ABcell2]|uniref:DUF971 domain-containing protein n=1 Tax=Marinimicrobium sp. ABcell2 TaxID=3069751 RepID=UPI0027B03284|nr:DUF971 domain-containing protein [Marinimicrobium sp. ABcell2]MDQ2076524.1 DUF971 domain-containing protein [Marinimicrobium sp. ABcell2]
MAGTEKGVTQPKRIPSKVQLHRKSRQLELQFGAQTFLLDAEYLRAHSTSAEVRGHGSEPGELPSGKQDVAIKHVAAAGNYALQLEFDDGHNSGIYTWDYLYELGENQARYWQEYLDKLHVQGKSRAPDTQVVKFI